MARTLRAHQPPQETYDELVRLRRQWPFNLALREAPEIYAATFNALVQERLKK